MNKKFITFVDNQIVLFNNVTFKTLYCLFTFYFVVLDGRFCQKAKTFQALREISVQHTAIDNLNNNNNKKKN